MFFLLHHKISMHVNRYLLHLVLVHFLVRFIPAAWEKKKQGIAKNCLFLLANILQIWYLNDNQGVEQKSIFCNQNDVCNLGCYLISVLNVKPDCHPSAFWLFLLAFFMCYIYPEDIFFFPVRWYTNELHNKCSLKWGGAWNPVKDKWNQTPS